MDLALLSGELTITRGALDKARLRLPSLAHMPDDEARTKILASVKASLQATRPIFTVDYRTNEPQALVRLGPVAGVTWDAWGTAIIRDKAIITVLDENGAKYVAGRGLAKEAEANPATTRIAALAASIDGIERMPSAELGGHAGPINALYQRLWTLARRARRSSARADASS